MADDLLAYYAAPGPFTTLGAFADEVDALPDNVGMLAAVVQNLLIHRFWSARYGVDLPAERETEQGLHGANAMLTRAIALQPGAITDERAPDRRVTGICRHFATLLCAFLRHKGIPARARCGFATYFDAGKYADHWICEYWNEGDRRWVQVDPQLDAFQRAALKPDFDPLDVPRDRFLVAGDVWRRIQAGEIDPATCGIAHMWGDWYVLGNLSLDAASLQKVELLPWEPFGIAKSPESAVPETPDLEALRSRVAELTTRGDDATIRELLALAEQDDRLRPAPATIDASLRADAAGPATGNPISV